MSGQDVLRERIARGIWDRSGNHPAWDDLSEGHVSRRRHFELADAVIAALGLREVHDGEGHYWQTPWERTEEDG